MRSIKYKQVFIMGTFLFQNAQFHDIIDINFDYHFVVQGKDICMDLDWECLNKEEKFDYIS